MPKQITTPEILIELSEDSVIAEFLNYQKKSTMHTYTSHFRRLKEFYDSTGQEMLEDPKLWKKKIFDFRAWLIERGYSETYAQTATGMIRGFFSFHEKPLFFNHTDSKRLAERNRKTEDYCLIKKTLAK